MRPHCATSQLCVALILLSGIQACYGAEAPRRAPDESAMRPAEQLGRAFNAVAERVGPAVVSVYSEKMVRFPRPDFPFPFGEEFFRRFFEQLPGSPRSPDSAPPQFGIPQRGMGAGMIIDRQGSILTCYHIVAEVDEIRVQLADKRSFEARIVSTDPPSDVAVIRIVDPPPDLPVVKLGDSDAVGIGHIVMAIGAPFGYVQTVTTGVLSARGRSSVGINTYEDFLQTDAAINPGNSGGPLLDMKGEVIGINSAIATRVGQFSGVGFAIPINMVKTMLPTLVAGKTIARGMLGVVIQEITSELAEQFGVSEGVGALVSEVSPDSPAQQAGIQPGDVILRFGDHEVQDTAHLRNLVAATAPGTKIRIGLVRNGKQISVTAIIGRLTPETAGPGTPLAPADNELEQLGLRVQTLTAELARQFDLDPGQQGVIITAIRMGSPAAAAGLQQGDLILEVDRRPIATVEQFRQALRGATDRKSVLLLVRREGSNLFVALKARERP